jgi:hypothetical protein
MNTLQLYILAPIIVALTYGMTHLLWTAVSIGFPPRSRRARPVLTKNHQRPVARKTPAPAFTHGRFARVRHLAALPQEHSHGIGTHLDN